MHTHPILTRNFPLSTFSAANDNNVEWDAATNYDDFTQPVFE